MEGLTGLEKSIFLGLFLVLFSVSVFSTPLEITGSNTSDFDGEITGGENLSVDVNFTNNMDENLTFLAVFTISSDEVKVTGEELTGLSGSLNGVSANCNIYENVSEYEKSFACTSGDFRVARPGSNSFEIVAGTSPYLYPAEYDMELDIRSVAGNSSPIFSESVVPISKGEFEVPLPGSTRLSINSSEDANLLIMNYTELGVDYPNENSEFLEALMIDVFKGQPGEPSFGDVEASGSLNFSYPERLDEENYSVGIYYYNESDGLWNNVTDDRDEVNNTVYAEVDHFSTYSAFATPQETEDDGGDETDGDDGNQGSPPPGFNPSPPSPPVEEPAENSSDENDSSQDSPVDNRTGNEEDDETNQKNEKEDQETGDEEGSGSDSPGSDGSYWFGDEGLGNFFTGFASEGPGNIYLGLIALIVTLLGVLQYTGRVDFVGRARSFSR